MFDSFFHHRLNDSGYTNTELLPLAFSPSAYYPIDAEKKYDISFIGIGFRKRKNIISAVKTGSKILVGEQWDPKKFPGQVLQERVNSEKANAIYNQSFINLNIHHFQSVNGSNLRTFEILGAGGFLLAEPLKDLKEMFVDGQDLVFYKDIDDLNNKISYYLNHDDERNLIALNGYKKVSRHHSFQARIDQIFGSLELV